MRDSVFFDGPASGARYSRFWMLLVLGDRTNLIRSLVLVLVLGGAAAAVVIGVEVGLLVQTDVISDTLPGVAIVISLVPPLTVAGAEKPAGSWDPAGFSKCGDGGI
ncbi:DUF389 domain-containing protein [Cryobacterium adonitolivorans]|uniref:DUF389 domain-containing protein n=2 Tax=Cryobacterium adonitolivorans TaxID=1259189 RepID=A0A4R8WEM9_9MICO|nr:DUF389 domain-containing protein [Cryobacterium adonitolivorans]